MFLLYTSYSFFIGNGWLSPKYIFHDFIPEYIWIIWSLMVFYGGYYIRKGYLEIMGLAMLNFPDLPKMQLIKIVKKDFRLKYLRVFNRLILFSAIMYVIAYCEYPLEKCNYIIIGTLLSIVLISHTYIKRQKDSQWESFESRQPRRKIYILLRTIGYLSGGVVLYNLALYRTNISLVVFVAMIISLSCFFMSSRVK